MLKMTLIREKHVINTKQSGSTCTETHTQVSFMVLVFGLDVMKLIWSLMVLLRHLKMKSVKIRRLNGDMMESTNSYSTVKTQDATRVGRKCKF